MNAKIIKNRKGALGELDEKDYSNFVKTMYTLNKGLISIKDYVKTRKDIADSSVNSHTFSDLQLDSMDEFISSLDFEEINSAYLNITRMLVPCSTDVTAITQALQLFSVKDDVVMKGAVNFQSLSELILEHTEKWSEFSDIELSMIRIMYSNIVSNVNYFVMINFFSVLDDEERCIEKSVNDYVKENKLDVSKELKIMQSIFEEYTPNVTDIILYPNKAVEFFNSIESEYLLDCVYDYREYITLEDMNAVAIGKLAVNEEFLEMLKSRCDNI